MYICENCGSDHNGEYGDSLKHKPRGGKSKYRFCSVKCSRSYSTKEKRKEINKAVSLKLKKPKTEKVKPILKKRKKKTKICMNCNEEFSGKDIYKRKYCSSKCSSEYIKKQTFNFIETHGYYKDYRKIKDYLIHKNGHTCSICNFSGDWNGKPIKMIADHINGRSSDNRLENIRLVCPMCDTQLPTFKSKNKKSDRKRVGHYSK
jgi:hypothetical protein